MTALASATPLAAGVGRRRSVLRTLALAGTGAMVGATTASSQDKLAEDGAAIRAALRRWRELYSYGDKPFSFAGFEDLYDGSDALLAAASTAHTSGARPTDAGGSCTSI